MILQVDPGVLKPLNVIRQVDPGVLKPLNVFPAQYGHPAHAFQRRGTEAVEDKPVVGSEKYLKLGSSEHTVKSQFHTHFVYENFFSPSQQ